jgi:predicted ATPase
VCIEFENDGYEFNLKSGFGDTLIFGFEKQYLNTGGELTNQWGPIATGHRESFLKEFTLNPIIKWQPELSSDSPNFVRLPEILHYFDFAIFHFSDTSDSAACKRLCDIDDNRVLRSDAANLAAFLYWIQQIHPTNYRRIVEHIRAVAPFFEDFTLAPSRHNPGKIKLEWKQRGSDAYFDAYSLSDGTLRFICLCVLLLQPEPPALIILDEPELGLHPAAIHLLAEMVEAASRQGQVLLATQSVTLLDHFAPSSVIVAEHDGRQSMFRRLSPEDLSQWLEDFSLGELWEKNVIGGRP